MTAAGASSLLDANAGRPDARPVTRQGILVGVHLDAGARNPAPTSQPATAPCAATVTSPGAQVPGGGVTVTGATLRLVGDVDRAAAELLRSRPAPQGISSVDMTAAGYVDGDAFHLILQCLQQLQCVHPGARLQILGADDRTRRHLELFGVTALVDLVHRSA